MTNFDFYYDQVLTVILSTQKEVAKPHIYVTDMKKSVENYLRDSGWEIKLQNAVYTRLKRYSVRLIVSVIA